MKIHNGHISQQKVEIFGLILLLLVLPWFGIAWTLPVNEYSWMASEGGQLPPDCDIVTVELFFPVGLIAVPGFLGFGLLALRRLSKVRVVGALLAAIMLLGIGLKLPTYFREKARAETLCLP